MALLKILGKAVAHKKGHYPGPDGRMRSVAQGATFYLLEGQPDKASWFTALPAALVTEPVAEVRPAKATRVKPVSGAASDLV